MDELRATAPAEVAGGHGSEAATSGRRDHPVLTPLVGFFAGLVLVLVVPGVFAATLDSLFEAPTVTDLFPLVLVALAVPLVLVVRTRTRRFGLFLALGMVTGAVVVTGVSVGVFWLMSSTS